MTNEALILIPPILCDARVFGPQITALSQSCTVQFANSKQGERIEEIASQILDVAPPRFALAGMGMGGTIALEIFRRAGNRVNRIALIATEVQSDTPEIAAMREPLIIAARAGKVNDIVAADLQPNALANTPDRPKVARTLQAMAMEFGMASYVKQARAMQRRKDQQDVLRKIKVPAMVMCGAEDTGNAQRRHEFMAGMIPYATFNVIPGASHMPTLENSDAATAALLKWMAEPFVLR